MQAKTGAFLNRLLPPLRPAKPVETEVFDPRGTGGSNPSSSSGESAANWGDGRHDPTPGRRVVVIAGERELVKIAYRRGEHDAAFDPLRAAIALEDDLPYDEPWGWMQPIRHALGVSRRPSAAAYSRILSPITRPPTWMHHLPHR